MTAARARGIDGWVGRRSLVGDAPFLPVETFSWPATLERNWRVIRAELDEVLRRRAELPNFQDISTAQRTLTDDDGWKTYFLFAYGYRSRANCAQCPKTAALISEVPGMTTAFFSILAPRKHIPEHRGPYKGLLRYHLGLVVPSPASACRIRVGDETRHWEEGASLLFDDRYPHEVHNDTDGLRAVLFMDVLRPLPPAAAAVNRAAVRAIALTPFVQSARRRESGWERRFHRT